MKTLFKIIMKLAKFAIILAAVVFCYIFWDKHLNSDNPDSSAGKRRIAAERESAKRAKERTQEAANSVSWPEEYILELKFRQSDRAHLRELYGKRANYTKGGSIREGKHPSGMIYLHQFIGTDDFGRQVEGHSAILFRTNALPEYIYYTQEQIPELLKEAAGKL